MVLALLCVAQVVVVLDVTIVAIALPTIQADLGLSPTVLGWVLTAYPVAFGGFLLAAGSWTTSPLVRPLRARDGAPAEQP